MDFLCDRLANLLGTLILHFRLDLTEKGLHSDLDMRSTNVLFERKTIAKLKDSDAFEK